MDAKVKSEPVVVSTPVNSPNFGSNSPSATTAGVTSTQAVPNPTSGSASAQFSHLAGFDFGSVRPPFPSPGVTGSNHGPATVQSLLQQQAHLLQLQQAHQLHELQQQQQQQQQHVTVGPELPSPGAQVPHPHIGYPGNLQAHAAASMLPMPSSHQLTLASQLARLRPGMMPSLGAQDLAGQGASLAAAAAAASLGLPFGLPHPHGLPLHGLGLGLGGMAANAERQGVMAGFGVTTQQQTMSNSTNYPSGFPSIPPPLMSPDFSGDMMPTEVFASISTVPTTVNPVAPNSQGDLTGSDCSERSGMTWLDAAQVVLEEAACSLHIKEIKRRILERGLVQSNAKSSLEAVLYRDTQRGSRRFKRVEGQNGVFGIMTAEDKVRKRNAPTHSTPRKRATAKDNAAVQSLRYKAKYRKLRKLIKLMIFENAALNDEVCRVEQKVKRAQQERFFLLQRVLHYQEICAVPPTSAKTPPSSRRPVFKRHGAGEDGDRRLMMSSLPSMTKREKGEKGTKNKRKHKKAKKAEKDKPRKDSGRSKSKRSSSMSTKRLVQHIPLDSEGKPVLPIKLSSLTVHSVGQIVTDRPAYHDEYCIYPAGFCSSRTYTSAKDPHVTCLYTCTVLDAGQKPRFEIVAEDEPDHPFVGSSPTECHDNLLDEINTYGGQEIASAKGKGIDFFGLTYPTIQHLIQCMPGARDCLRYKWMKFTTARSHDQGVRGQTKHKARDSGKKSRREVGSSVRKYDQSDLKQDQDSLSVSTSADPACPLTSSGSSLRYLLSTPTDPIQTDIKVPDEPSEEPDAAISPMQTRSKPTITKDEPKLSTMQTRSKPAVVTVTKTKPDLQPYTKPDLQTQTKPQVELQTTRVQTRSNLPNQVQTRSKPTAAPEVHVIKTEPQGEKTD